MIKMVFAIRRLPHLSPEEFHRYWREDHGRLAQKNLPALRVKRYVQTHTLDTPFNEVLRESRGGGEPYDGVVEIWWVGQRRGPGGRLRHVRGGAGLRRTPRG